MIEENDEDAELENISKWYLCNVSPFPWSLADKFLKSSNGQTVLLYKTIKHPEAILFPASGVYRQRFLKYWISQAEDDVLEEIYELYCEMMGGALTQIGYKIYTFGGNLIKIKETVAMCSSGTTGLRTWEACLVMCEWCTEHVEIFKDRHVLELGCGTGLLGITLSLTTSPTSVLLTDYHPDVLTTAQSNITLNTREGHVSTREGHVSTREGHVSTKKLDWCEQCYVKCDVIVAADVIFDPYTLLPLAKTIKLLLTSSTFHSPVCYVSSTVRNKETYQTFLSYLDDVQLRHLSVEERKEGHSIVEILKISL